VPALAASLIGSVRVHLYGCAMSLRWSAGEPERLGRCPASREADPGTRRPCGRPDARTRLALRSSRGRHTGAAVVQELVAFAQTTREEAREEPRCAIATAESVRSPHVVHQPRPPMALRVSDRLVDETGEYEGIGRPYTTTGGKTANVRVKHVDSDVTMIRTYGAYERVNVKRAIAEEDTR
jgi:hypothetical protein